MNTFNPNANKRKFLPYILGGCAILSLCLMFACTANAAYWTLRQRSTGSLSQQNPRGNQNEQGSSPASLSSDGEAIFYVEGGCSACHSLEPGKIIVGPSLQGVSARAVALEPPYTVESYIYESITNPNAYVVDGFKPDIMPAKYGERLSEQQLAALVSFLSTK